MLPKTVDRAIAFSTLAHEGQKRKYTGADYITHPLAVAEIVAATVGDGFVDMIEAALLHDVVEDAGIKIEEIEAEFGKTTADLVDQLTNKTEMRHGYRSKRKAMDRKRLSGVSNSAKTIKLADRIHNLPNILYHDDGGFAKVYLKETRLLLPVLEGGAPSLFAILKEMVDSL